MDDNIATYDPDTDSVREAHVRSTEQAMREAGQPIEEKIGFEDYFTYEETKRWYFPDGKQYIEYQPMTEGDRRRYQSKTMTTMSLNRASGDSKIGINVARDREALLDISVKNWYMVRNGNEIPFTDRQFGWQRWVTIANPKLIEDLEKEIRKANPWMQADMDLEEVDAEIKRLEELRLELQDRKQGE